ncbi:alpha/beta hydrolase family protein [Flexithrix dorotheae]|uniref:alpha/beta hydrolase family protein n=1 Tax=Flexithrix dorotheae TaxID=70993 RepID=UPI00037D8BEF|nr:alpha/beta fold hydrolase [Flexithrix dorotheae]
MRNPIFLAISLYSCLLLFCFSCTGKIDHNYEKLEGSWIGTLEKEPFPELVSLYIDSALLVKMYYTGIDLHVAKSYNLNTPEITFEVDQPELNGKFTGKLEGDEIKGNFNIGGKDFACNFFKIEPIGLGQISEYVGFYQLEEDHIIQVNPFMLDFSLTPLSVLDFKTGKKRVAFPTSKNTFEAGEKMLAPYPKDFNLTFSKTEDNIKLSLEDNGKTLNGERLAGLPNPKDIVAENKGVELKGSLTLPQSEGPHPLVVFVHGGGNQTRENNSFADFSLLLPYYGIATLVYDKRGCGESTGELQGASFEELANDLKAVLERISKEKSINQEKIGLLGIDQAGFIMPMAASKSDKVKFMVNISGSAKGIEDQEYQACALRMKADGFSEDEINEAVEYQKKMFDFLRGKVDSVAFQLASDKMAGKSWSGYVTSFDKKEWINWWRVNYTCNPKDYLPNLKIPQLVIYGEKDLLVPPKENIPLMEKYLEGTHHSILEFKAANHLLLLGEKRGDVQFSEIEGYPENLFSTINNWIGEQTGLKK